VVDLGEILRGEFAENAERKDFLPSEIDAVRRAMVPMVAIPRGRPHVTEISESFANFEPVAAAVPEAGKTSDKIGAFAGVSGRTVEKIARVTEAAQAQPERFGHLVEEMDRTGKVDRAYSQVARAQRHEAIAEKAGAVPLGTFPPDLR
jgi:hypothetical protein